MKWRSRLKAFSLIALLYGIGNTLASAEAAQSTTCADLEVSAEKSDKLKFYQRKFKTGECVVSFIPTGSKKFPRTQWFFNSFGRISAFVEMLDADEERKAILAAKEKGEEPYKKQNRNRVLYIFPYESELSIIDPRDKFSIASASLSNPSKTPLVRTALNQQTDQVKVPSGLTWTVDKAEGTLSPPPECEGKISPGTIENEGGLNLTSCENKLIVDVGVAMGEAPELRSPISTIRFPNGQSCSVSTSELFHFRSEPGSKSKSIYFPKYTTTNDWITFLEKSEKLKKSKTSNKCPSSYYEFLKAAASTVSKPPRTTPTGSAQ